MSNVVALTALTRIRHRRFVPTVPVELLVEAADRLATAWEMRGDRPHDIGTAAGMTIRGLRDTKPIDELGELGVNLEDRLTALVMHIESQAYPRAELFSLLHGEAPKILRAASRAPLKVPGKGATNYRFELATFLKVIQEEGQANIESKAADS
jgi:hypothetical protein